MQHPFPYEVIYSDRKSLAIQITAQATVRVRVPKNCPAPTIDTFLYEKQAWILKHLDSASQRLEQSSEKPQISENDRKMTGNDTSSLHGIFLHARQNIMPVSWASPTAVSPSGNRKPAGEAAPALEI